MELNNRSDVDRDTHTHTFTCIHTATINTFTPTFMSAYTVANSQAATSTNSSSPKPKKNKQYLYYPLMPTYVTKSFNRLHSSHFFLRSHLFLFLFFPHFLSITVRTISNMCSIVDRFGWIRQKYRVDSTSNETTRLSTFNFIIVLLFDPIINGCRRCDEGAHVDLLLFLFTLISRCNKSKHET